jgi:hypothetical protein
VWGGGKKHPRIILKRSKKLDIQCLNGEVIYKTYKSKEKRVGFQFLWVPFMTAVLKCFLDADRFGFLLVNLKASYELFVNWFPISFCGVTLESEVRLCGERIRWGHL